MSNFFRKLRNEWRNMLDVLSNPIQQFLGGIHESNR